MLKVLIWHNLFIKKFEIHFPSKTMIKIITQYYQNTECVQRMVQKTMLRSPAHHKTLKNKKVQHKNNFTY